MKTAIALMVGWAVGFGGPIVAPDVPWSYFVAFGSFLAFLIVSMDY